MARDHARVYLSIWDDDDFCSLSPAAQHLYFALMTAPEMNYAGVTDWRPNRLCKRAGAWTERAVEVAAQELSERRYIVVDVETEEVLLRSLIRHDGLLEQPNLAVAVWKAWAGVASRTLRGVVVHELNRLRKDKPDLKGWPKIEERDLLSKPSIDPSVCPSFHPSDDPSVDPSRKGSVDPSVRVTPNPSDDPSVKGSPITAPGIQLPTPNSQLHKNQNQDLGVNGPETLQPAAATNPPPTKPPDRRRCTEHQGVADPPPCAGCKAARERTDREDETAEDRERDRRQRELEAARNACTDCDGTWLTDDQGKPTRKRCTHPNARRTA